jgi:hypothetical protein
MKKFDHNHYNPRLKEYARELRTETVSKAEKRIWKGFCFHKNRMINRILTINFRPLFLSFFFKKTWK